MLSGDGEGGEVAVLGVVEDEELLLDVLNSAPVVEGRPTDRLAGSAGAALARRHGGLGLPAEVAHLRAVRDVLQDVVRGRADAIDGLVPIVEQTVMRPRLDGDTIRWSLDSPTEVHLAARVVLAWSRVHESMPGRLRPCADTDCNLFLVDHSRPGTARWCSMAACGNRAKARTHARRRRSPAQVPSPVAQEVDE